MNDGSGAVASAVEPVAEACQKRFDVCIDDLIVDISALTIGLEESASLEESQVFAGHVRGNGAGLGQFTDAVFVVEQHLKHPQSNRMRERAEAISGLFESGQLGRSGRGDDACHL